MSKIYFGQSERANQTVSLNVYAYCTVADLVQVNFLNIILARNQNNVRDSECYSTI